MLFGSKLLRSAPFYFIKTEILFHSISNVFINKIFRYTTGGSKSDAESIKAKNIMQTELMIRLRDAILRVSRYFQVRKYKNFNINVVLETS